MRVRKKLDFLGFFRNRKTYSLMRFRGVNSFMIYAQSCRRDRVEMKKITNNIRKLSIVQFLKYTSYENYLIRRIMAEEDLERFGLGDRELLNSLVSKIIKKMDIVAKNFLTNMPEGSVTFFPLNSMFSLISVYIPEKDLTIDFVTKKHIPIIFKLQKSEPKDDITFYKNLSNVLFVAVRK